MSFGTFRVRTLASAIALVVAAACSRDPETAKREYVKSGDGYMRDHKVAEAIVQYRNAVQQDPRFGEARKKLAEAYEQSGDVRSAFVEYVRASDLLPADVALQVKAGNLLLLVGQFEDARARALQALKQAAAEQRRTGPARQYPRRPA